MKEKMYQLVITVMLILFAVFFVVEDKNYNDLLDVNDELIQLLDENRENYNSNYDSMRITIEELQLENFRLERDLEKAEESYLELYEKTKPTYTEEEYETLAHLLYAEAGGESDTCIMYVGSVVLNRVASNKFPNTVLDVIYQDGQYSPTWNGFMQKTVENPNCYKIAKFLLENGSILPSEVLGQSNYSVFKKYGSKLFAEIDGEYFFYLKED